MNITQNAPEVGEDTYALFSQAPKGPTYLAEAEFGLAQIAPLIAALPAGSRVLEVGSGPCIALAGIARARPDLVVQGIEPVGSGFAHFQDFIESIQASCPNMHLFRGGYEQFPMSGGWDLIFLVNVFEHLPNWRHFLRFVRERLADNGACVILCPNYGFPYESHFRLPIILEKATTRRAFAKRIAQFEGEHDLRGLYDSLNFVKLADVRVAAREAGLALEVDVAVIRAMIDRLDSDREFASRQRAIAPLAKLVRRSALLDWMLSRESFQNRLPYMKLILRRKA